LILNPEENTIELFGVFFISKPLDFDGIKNELIYFKAVDFHGIKKELGFYRLPIIYAYL